jgi:hypothetical protein
MPTRRERCCRPCRRCQQSRSATDAHVLARRRVQVRLKPLRLQEIAILRLRTLLSTPGFCRHSRIRAACAPAYQSASHTRSSRPEGRTAAIATRIEMIRSFRGGRTVGILACRPSRLIACTVTAIRSLQPRENLRVEAGRVGFDRFFYFGAGAELEGGLTAGPLLLPGNPGTLVAS